MQFIAINMQENLLGWRTADALSPHYYCTLQHVLAGMKTSVQNIGVSMLLHSFKYVRLP